jgi:phosphatidylglycerophosphatase A
MNTKKTTASAEVPWRWSLPLQIATWFGCGYAPFAPGTWGSAGALVPAMLLVHAGWRPLWFLALAAAAFPVSVWAAGWTAQQAGKKDPSLVVVDEVIGQWVTLAGATTLNWKSWLAAFVLFRVMDIWKPAPVRQLESLPGGYGIVADDVMAGVYGAIVLFAAGYFGLY